MNASVARAATKNTVRRRRDQLDGKLIGRASPSRTNGAQKKDRGRGRVLSWSGRSRRNGQKAQHESRSIRRQHRWYGSSQPQ